jgi:hypothetical protein
VKGTERNDLKSHWSDEILKIFEISLVEADIKCKRGESGIKFRHRNGGTNVKALFMHKKVLVKMVPTILTGKKCQHAEVCPDFMRELLQSVLSKIITGKK